MCTERVAFENKIFVVGVNFHLYFSTGGRVSFRERVIYQWYYLYQVLDGVSLKTEKQELTKLLQNKEFIK